MKFRIREYVPDGCGLSTRPYRRPLLLQSLEGEFYRYLSNDELGRMQVGEKALLGTPRNLHHSLPVEYDVSELVLQPMYEGSARAKKYFGSNKRFFTKCEPTVKLQYEAFLKKNFSLVKAD